MKSFLNKLILSSKIFVRPKIWKVLDFYERIFSKKRKKANEFDKIIRENQVYFTTDINTDGFSDQLIRLIFFYKVGKSLGMKYYFTPLESHRSTTAVSTGTRGIDAKDSNSDVYDFLGVNEYLERISAQIPESNYLNIVFDLDRIEFTRRDRDSFSNLLFFLKTKLADRIPSGKNVLIHFRSSPNAFLLYHLTVPISEHSLNFREVYLQKREKNPRPSKFLKDKIKLMVHIRQGDTAIIQTPWKSYIPVWYKIENRYREVNSRDEIEDYEVIDVDIYYTFLKRLFEYFDPEYFSTAIYSDGFDSALKIIEDSDIFLKFTESQRSEWTEHKQQYNRRQFEKFYNRNEMNIEIGEEKKKLHDLIQSFFEAEIIIFGTQAKMIPKLLAIYSDAENMPFIINLYREKEPNIDYLGIQHSWPRVFFVDVNNYDVKAIAGRIKEYLAAKNKDSRSGSSLPLRGVRL